MTHGKLNGDDYFDRWHEDGDIAFAILQDGCEYPPSCEVFEHELELRRKRTHLALTVQNHARYIVDNYQRVES